MYTKPLRWEAANCEVFIGGPQGKQKRQIRREGNDATSTMNRSKRVNGRERDEEEKRVLLPNSARSRIICSGVGPEWGI